MAGPVASVFVDLGLNSARFQDGLKKAGAQVKGFEAQTKVSLAGAGAAFRRLGGALLAGVSIRGMQVLIDSATRITNALKVAGLEGAELTRVYDTLFASAQRNAAPFEALVTLYGRASQVQKELGVSTAEMLRFTDKVALALRVSGRSAQESSGALLQLSQALGSGVVRAQEFNSMLEGALPIVQAAAAGIAEAGGSVAKLRQLVNEGKVSSQAFFRGFEAGAVILEEKVAGAELTVSQGFVRLQNVLVAAAGKLNDVTGAGRIAADALGAVATALEWISDREGPVVDTLSNVTGGMNDLSESIGRFMRDGSFENLIDMLFFGTPNSKIENALLGQAAAVDRLREGLRKLREEAAARSAGTPVAMSEAMAGRFADAFGAGVKPISLADFAPPADTDKTKKAIERLNPTLTALHDQADRIADRFYEASRAAQGFADVLVGDLRAGKSAVEALGNALANLANRLLDMGLSTGLNILMGRMTGGIVSPKIPGFAMGGGFTVGGPGGIDSQLVAFRATPGEMVDIRKPGQDIGGGARQVSINVNVEGANGDQHVIDLVAQGVRQGITAYDRALPNKLEGKIRQVIDKPRHRGGGWSG